MIVKPGAKHGLGLLEHARDLLQPCHVVFVMLDAIERHRQRQIGKGDMRTVHLTHWHLVFLEGVIVEPLSQRPQHHLAGHRILVGKT